MANTSRGLFAGELRQMRAKADKLFEKPIHWSPLPTWSRLRRLATGVRTLPIDMFETSDSVVIRATVAGVRPEDVSICVTGNILAIRTESKEKTELKGAESIKRERFCGRFERCVALPRKVKVEKAQATLRNSELVLRLPKVEEKPKYIKVQSSRVLRDR